MFCRILFLCYALIPLAFPAPASAQSNPTKADCGLPVSGTITSDVIYTLDEDCTQTGVLKIPSSVTSAVTLTINGGGHKITMASGLSVPINFIAVDDGDQDLNHQVKLNNVTFDGNSQRFTKDLLTGGIGTGISVDGTLTGENITFTGGNGIFLEPFGTATLTNVHFADNEIRNLGFKDTVKGATLHVPSTGRVTLHDATFRNNGLTNVVVESGGQLTTTGCLSFSGNLTHDVIHSKLSPYAGTWTDNSTGPCKADQAATQQPSLNMMDCGLPNDPLIDSDKVFTLTGDCESFQSLVIASGVRVTINAMGNRIASGADTSAQIRIGGLSSLTIDKAILDNVRLINFHGTLSLRNSQVRRAAKLALVNYGDAYVQSSIFEDNRGSETFSSVYYGENLFASGSASFRRVAFRRNSGGPTVLKASGKGVVISMCEVSFVDNIAEPEPPEGDAAPIAVAEDGARLSGGRGTPCPIPPTPTPTPEPRGGGGCRPGHINLPPNKNLGAIGFACHVQNSPTAIEIWEISPDNQGSFALSVNQREIEAMAEGLVACSRTGRAAVRVGLTDAVRQQIMRNRNYRDPSVRGGRDIVISLGPTSEGKVHHYVIDTVLDGDVLGTVDTFSNSPPCPDSGPTAIHAAEPTATQQQIYAPPVSPQAPRADGSIVHVVGQGDTVWAIGVAYGVHPHDIIALNELPERGLFIRPGQELLIRAAE